MKLSYDTIIIGSGFGGSVAASTLSSAGQNVLLIERGPWRDSAAVRAAGIQNASSLPKGYSSYLDLLHRVGYSKIKGTGKRLNRHGLFDIHFGSEMTVVCSNGVGGGSHVYSAMNTRPANNQYWNHRSNELSATSMEEHYQWMISTMGAKEPNIDDKIPNFTGERFASSPHFIANDKTGQPAMSVSMNGDAENYRDNSFFGSENGAKATLDRILLIPAKAQGLEIAALHECLSIWKTHEGYRLEVMDHNAKRIRQFSAKRVILAAGTLNTLRLLFRSRALGGLTGLKNLGHGFGGNGDVPGYWAVNEAGTDFTQGIPCHGRFALRDSKGDIEILPDLLPVDLTSYGLNGIGNLPMPNFLRRRLKQDLVVVGMGSDNADGVVEWLNGKLSIHYIRQNNPILKSICRHFDEIARRSQRPIYYTERHPLTVHPLGGARLSATPDEGVINGNGEVWDSPGLFIADASALPAAPGTPPSMTISAWSRHVALKILTQQNNNSGINR